MSVSIVALSALVYSSTLACRSLADIGVEGKSTTSPYEACRHELRERSRLHFGSRERRHETSPVKVVVEFELLSCISGLLACKRLLQVCKPRLEARKPGRGTCKLGLQVCRKEMR